MYISENCNWTPYGTDDKKDMKVDSANYEDRVQIASKNYGLDKLVYDRDPYVRRQVAEQGFGLDILINDGNYKVREMVAEQGYGLDKLVYDEHEAVRMAVAEHGYRLDILFNDISYLVRSIVAEKGYRLDELVHDSDMTVREEVARQGYGLDILINDKYSQVRLQCALHNYGLDKLVYDEDETVRCAVAEKGYGLDILLNDEDVYVREEVVKYLEDHNISFAEWCTQNNKICSYIDLKDFVDKISTLPKIKIRSDYDYSIEEYFNDLSEFSFSRHVKLAIITSNTNEVLIKLEKVKYDNKKTYILYSNIDDIKLSTIYNSKDSLDKFISNIIDALHNSIYKEYFIELKKYL